MTRIPDALGGAGELRLVWLEFARNRRR